MMCPDCRQLRHLGPCDPYYSDMETYERDMQEIEIGRAQSFLDEARKKIGASDRTQERGPDNEPRRP